MSGRPTVLREVKQSILRNDTCQHIYDQEKKEIEQRICWPIPIKLEGDPLTLRIAF